MEPEEAKDRIRSHFKCVVSLIVNNKLDSLEILTDFAKILVELTADIKKSHNERLCAIEEDRKK